MTFVDLDQTMFNEHSEQPEEEVFENERTTGTHPHMMKPRNMIEEDTANQPTSQPTKKKRLEKNQDFQDVENTGKWGKISRNEVICVALTAFAIIVGVVVAVVLMVIDKEDGGETVAPPPEAVVIENVYMKADEHYTALVAKIMESKVADSILTDLPADASALEKMGNPVAEAAAWLIFSDPVQVKTETDLIPRFVMANIYIAHNGFDWINAEGWMSAFNVCEWHGISCNPAKEILEVDLASNGLTGKLQDVWALLPKTSSVLLNDNAITGPIPGTAFGAMPLLTYLYLQDNELTGTIPVSLKDTGVLDTLFVQNNQLTGSWPAEFCPECRECDPPFQEFGLNCDKMECFCCIPILNCFN